LSTFTTIQGAARQTLARTGAMIVESRAKWSDPWEPNNEIYPVRVAASGTADAPGQAELLRRYGPAVKDVHAAAFEARGIRSLVGQWVRLRITDQEANTVVWVGRITDDPRVIYGESSDPAGQQKIVAYDALHLLDRVRLGESVWDVGGIAQRIKWLPSFNLRNAENELAGNRSTNVLGTSYLFAGTGELWDFQQMVTYLLEQFVDEAGDDPDGVPYDPAGPLFVLGGQATLLTGAQDVIAVQAGDSVLDVLRRIISPARGTDFQMVYLEGDGDGNGEGWELYVYSLLPQTATFGGVTLPQNTRTKDIRVSEENYESVQVMGSGAERVGRIRVRGRRAIVAVTLEGANLVGKWPASLETKYKAGAGSSLPDGGAPEASDHDRARGADEFSDVYQKFAAPDDWDWNGGTATAAFDANGEFILDASNPAFQETVRRTLNWTPFQTGYGYSTGAAVPVSDIDGRPRFLPPNAWLYHETLRRYVAGNVEIRSISALRNDWGLRVNASPNHLLARGHFGSAAESATDDLEDGLPYDYAQMVLTIGIETDTPAELVYEIDNWRPSDGEMVVEVDAEAWFAAPGTVYGVSPRGELLRTPEDRRTVLRNDLPRLYAAMAGLVSRYARKRGRAILHKRGLIPDHALLGTMLTVIEAGASDAREIHAVVNEVEWFPDSDSQRPQPSTIVRAGHAR
jgi:hypothetical protein